MNNSPPLQDYSFVKMAAGEDDVTRLKSMLGNKLVAVQQWAKDNLLFVLTMAGVMLGVALGLFLRPRHLGSTTVLLMAYPGELFMRLLKLMILPLIIASLIAGSSRLNAAMNGRIAARAVVYFLLTSLANAALGVALALMLRPGVTVDAGGVTAVNVVGKVTPGEASPRDMRILDGFLDMGRNVIPDNLFQATFQQSYTVYIPIDATSLAINDTENGTADDIVANPNYLRVVKYRDGTNTLGIIFFCLVFGMVLGSMGSSGRVVIEFFSVVDRVIMKMVSVAMWLTPLGVSSLISSKIVSVADLGLVVQQLGWFVLTVTIGIAITQFILNQLIYFAVIRRNPFAFYCQLLDAMLIAFATAATAAALPATLRLMDERVKMDRRVSRFVLLVGCAVNMDGTALFVATAAIFVAQLSHLQLAAGELVTVWLAATAASFSSASVPSAALVLIFTVLATVSVPTHDVSLLFAVDWLVDRIRTTNNMLGDCYAAAVVQHLSGNELSAANDASAMQVDHIEPPADQPLSSVTTNGVVETPCSSVFAQSHAIPDERRFPVCGAATRNCSSDGPLQHDREAMVWGRPHHFAELDNHPTTYAN